jgi:phosphatidylserine/phosphatidylglycerophosphate/cardiolipin synthase-like enzyme
MTVNSFGFNKAQASYFIDNRVLKKMISVSQNVKLASLFSSAISFGVTKARYETSTSFLYLSLGTLLVSSLWHYGSLLMAAQRICKEAKTLADNDMVELPNPIEPAICDAFPTENCADTEFYRNQLILNAKHNIIISGNFCGGKAFANLLALIESRLKENDKLKVIILSSPLFLLEQHQQQIQKLSKLYPERFSFILTPNIFHIVPHLKFSTNHTKCTVIDYGQYFMLGGSGIKDSFSKTGLVSVTREVFLKDKEAPIKLDHEPEQKMAEESDKLSVLLGEFRDMDWVFKSKQHSLAGKRVFQQMLLLCQRWEVYSKDDLESNSNHSSLSRRMLKDSTTPDVSTDIAVFSKSSKKAENVAFKLLALGPDQSESLFTEEIVTQTRKAKKTILIEHMYFHPTIEIMNALVEAAKKGIRIKIITSCNSSTSSYAQTLYAARNKYNYTYLLDHLPENAKRNVEIFAFKQKGKTLHKKLIIIDGTKIIAGSSNLGFKSLVRTSDDELSFCAHSKELVEYTEKVVEEDIRHSTVVVNPRTTFCDKVQALAHYCIAHIFG